MNARTILRAATAAVVSIPLFFLGGQQAGAQPSPRTTYGTSLPSGPNPWVYTMTDPSKDGMVINGVPNSLSQILLIKDPYGAPIFGVGHVGGAGVYGDHFRVFPGNDVFHPVVDISPTGRISITGSEAGVWIDGQLLTSADIAWIHSHE